MDDTANSRLSDAAATRKRRSSILKSYRPQRAPLSELEFNVVTPTDTAKSRRVSFSRRTGVAEFVTNEATTTWKNFYEEQNKTLESSGNDSEVNPPRPSVGHIGKRIFDQQFQEVDACDFLTLDDGGRNVNNSMNNENLFHQFEILESTNDSRISARQQKFELSSFTNNHTKMFADDFTASGMGEVSDHISVNFTNLQPIPPGKDDLEDIEKDLKRKVDAGNVVYSSAFRPDVSEYIEVDLNMTHVGVRNDESDMSITDTIRNPKVNVMKSFTESKSSLSVERRDSKNWVLNKENIAINPYVAPKESTNFAINEELDKVLVFDGKRLTIQTESKEQLSRTSVSDLNVGTLRKSIVLNVDDDLPNFVDNPQTSVGLVSMCKSVLGNDNDIKNKTMSNSVLGTAMPVFVERRKTIVYDNNEGDISVTQAVPSNIIFPENVFYSSNSTEFENEGNRITPPVSNVVINVSPHVACPQDFSSKMIRSQGGSEKTEIVVDDESNIQIVSSDTIDESNIQIVSSDPILLGDAVLSKEKRKTTVYESENGNMYMTRFISENLVIPEYKLPEKRKTIVFESDNDISMTQAVSGNVILPENHQEISGKRKTIVFDSEDADISTTEAVPSNIIVPMIENPKESEKTKTICDVSMTQAIAGSINLSKNEDKRKTILFYSENADISMTQAIPAVIFMPEVSKKRKTIVFESDNDISMTQGVPGNIVLTENQETVPKKAITIVFEPDSADISMTQAILSNLLPQTQSQDMLMTKVPESIIEENKEINDNSKTGDMSVTQAVPLNIIEPIREISKKSALNLNETSTISLPISIPEVVNPNKSVCNADISDTKYTTNIPQRQTTVGDNDIYVITNTQPLPANLQFVENDSGSISLSSSSKETVRKRLSQEMEVTMTDFNHPDKGIEEPQVTIHTHSNLSKMFRAEKIANLSLSKPIPADLLTIQKILDKSNVNQLFNIDQEKEPTKQNFMVYQTSADKGVIPPINTDADSIMKESIPSDTQNLSKTDLQHNKGQIELFEQNSQSPSLKDKENPVSSSNYLLKSPPNKSKTSHVASSVCLVSNNSDQSIPLAVVSTSASQQSRSIAEGSNSPLLHWKPETETSSSPSDRSRLFAETLSQQSKDGDIKQGSKKSLLVDLLDMSYASLASGLEDKSITAKIESASSVKKPEPHTYDQKVPDEKAEKSVESLFYITSASEGDKSDEDKEINPKEVPLPLPNKEPSDVNDPKTSMMRYLQQKLTKLKEKMPSHKFFEKVVSPDKESYMTEQLLEMLDSFTDVEEQTNPLDEINTVEDQNKFLSIATRNRQAMHGSNRKVSKKKSPVSPRTNPPHGSLGYGASPAPTRPTSGQGVDPIKKGFKKEPPVSPRVGSNKWRGSVSPRKSPIAGNESLSPRIHSATRQVSSPRVGKEQKICKKEKKSLIDNDQEKKFFSKKELLHNLIEKVSALEDHLSGENLIEDGMIYLINDMNSIENKDENDDTKRILDSDDTIETIGDVGLYDQIKEVLNEEDLPKETLMGSQLLYNPTERVNSSPDYKGVTKDAKSGDDLFYEPMNEINILDDKDMSCVLKEAIMVKELLYPAKENTTRENITRDEKNTRKGDTVGKGLLSIEDKDVEGTTSEPLTRQTISIACSLEDLNSKRRSDNNPRRQSVVISKEDLMNNISLAQAILQKELEETPMDLDSTQSNTKEKKIRINNEVVKSLRFEDNTIEDASDSYLGLSAMPSAMTSPLKKTVFGETSYMTDLKKSDKPNVIPTYLKDVSEGIKQLMSDLMKPDADADVLPFSETKMKKNTVLKRVPSTRSNQAQADLFTSSQVDLQPESVSTTVSQQSSNTIQMRRITKTASNKSVTVTFDDRPVHEILDRRSVNESSNVIIFDPDNPLNNIFIKPVGFDNAHSYKPLTPEDSLTRRNSLVSFKEDSVEKMSTQYNVRTIRKSFTETNLKHKEKVKTAEDKMLQVDGVNIPSHRITEVERLECIKMSNFNTLHKISEVDSLEIHINSNVSVDKAVDVLEATNRDAEVNTDIAMRDNVEILLADSSLTIVDEAGDSEAKIDMCAHSNSMTRHGQVSGVKIIYEQHKKNSEQISNVQNHDQIANMSNNKRKHSPTVDHKHCVMSASDVTPKPAMKIPKNSTTPIQMLKYDEWLRSLSSPLKSNSRTTTHSSPSKTSHSSSITIDSQKTSNKPKTPNSKRDTPKDTSESPEPRTRTAESKSKASPNSINSRRRIVTTINRMTVEKPNIKKLDGEVVDDLSKDKLYDNKTSASCSKTEITQSVSNSISCGENTGVTMDWLPELINELSSKNLVTECESNVNVLNKIDALPFMGSIECSWENGDSESWSFRLLHGRLRLRVLLEPQHKTCNEYGACVRSDTPIMELKIDNLHQDKKNSIALFCVNFAAEAMRYLSSRPGVYTRAGDVPALLRRCAGVARVALKWGRAMHEAWSHLAYTVTENGLLSLKVANVPLRAMWEVTMQLELVVEDAREVPWPRASDLRVTTVVSDHIVSPEEVYRLLHYMRKDWGHVPGTIWNIFRYLKYKSRDCDLLLTM